jgi:hypothetical protein
LFIGTVIIPSSGQTIGKTTARGGHWLYVGGSGPGNYSKIQAAVNDAKNSDTVFVYSHSSPYYENNIWINSSITLLGEDKNTTIIDGKGGGGNINVICISANNVKVMGFTIRNCSGQITDTGILITHSKDPGIKHYRDIKFVFNANITGNIFLNTATGIQEIKTFHTSIFKNLITSSGISDGFKNITDFGIGEGASASIIRQNSIINPHVSGIDLSLTHCLIEDNIISNGTQPGKGWGITQMFCSNKIIGNTITNFSSGITFNGFCLGNLISDNHISDCQWGIFFSRPSIFTMITSNNIEKCNDYGILLDSTLFTTVKKNNFLQNHVDAYFRNCFGIRWTSNYWDDWDGSGPMRVNGLYYNSYDWHPAQEPYDIPGMT